MKYSEKVRQPRHQNAATSRSLGKVRFTPIELLSLGFLIGALVFLTAITGVALSYLIQNA